MWSSSQSPVLGIKISHSLLDTVASIVKCLVAPVNLLFDRALNVRLDVSLNPLNQFILEEIRLYKILHFRKLRSVVSGSTKGDVFVASQLSRNTVAHLDLADSSFHTVNIWSTFKTLGALPFPCNLVKILSANFLKISFQFGKIFRHLAFLLSFSFPLLWWNCVLLL